MKNQVLLILFFVLIASTFAIAQKTIDAKQISKSAKAGKDVVYDGVIVRGMLDFTNYSEEVDNLPTKSWRWWNTGSNYKNERVIEGKILFRNCTFKDDVIAYIVEQDEYLFTASFDNEVVFENCTFKGLAAFKYSTFESKADFSDSRFEDEMNFKYAKFYRSANFSGVSSREEANFKYAKFNRMADFSSVKVRDEANFKYAKFNGGLNIQDADFSSLLNFKYAAIDGDFNTGNVRINDLDTKYAKVNGASFSRYLLTSRD